MLSKSNLQRAYHEWLLPLRTLVMGIMTENKNDYDQFAIDTVCTLNPVELVLYRCIELVEEKLKHSTWISIRIHVYMMLAGYTSSVPMNFVTFFCLSWKLKWIIWCLLQSLAIVISVLNCLVHSFKLLLKRPGTLQNRSNWKSVSGRQYV